MKDRWRTKPSVGVRTSRSSMRHTGNGSLHLVRNLKYELGSPAPKSWRSGWETVWERAKSWGRWAKVGRRRGTHRQQVSSARGGKEDQQRVCVCLRKSLSHVWLFAALCPHLCSCESPGKNTGVGCHALLQGIFPTQGLNPGLPHCRGILYHLSHQGSPPIWYKVPQTGIEKKEQKSNKVLWTYPSAVNSLEVWQKHRKTQVELFLKSERYGKQANHRTAFPLERSV